MTSAAHRHQPHHPILSTGGMFLGLAVGKKLHLPIKSRTYCPLPPYTLFIPPNLPLSPLTMSKTEQKACLSTSHPHSQPLPRHASPTPQPIPRPNLRRVKSAPATVQIGSPPKRPDYVLACCFVLVYLELGWLILLLLRSYSRH